jgi:two-component system, OmpR family, alkaline phosphatase synthesis response regulator PhoP
MSEKKLILVVDDDPDLVEAVSMKLEAKSYRVEKAYDGVEAMDKIKIEKPAVVILDVMMPRKNGWEVCDEIKNSKELKDIAVVLLTAVADSVKARPRRRRRGGEDERAARQPEPHSGRLPGDALPREQDDHRGARTRHAGAGAGGSSGGVSPQSATRKTTPGVLFQGGPDRLLPCSGSG